MQRTLLTLALVSPSFAQTTFTIVGTGGFAAANEDGTAIVGTDSQGAFLWTAANGYVPLGQEAALDVSEDGLSVLGLMTEPATGSRTAGIWTAASGWQSLGGLGGSCFGQISEGHALSGDADTAVGLAWLGCQERAVRSTGVAGMQALPTQTSQASAATAISTDGSWIGGWEEDANGDRRACIWDPNQTQAFTHDNSTWVSGANEVRGLSPDGAFAVGSEGLGSFLWERATNTATYLGSVPGGTAVDRTALLCVDEAGQRAGGAFGPLGIIGRAILWSPSKGYEDLDDVLAAGGVDLGTWETKVVSYISPDGNVLVGTARPVASTISSVFIATLGAGDLGTNFCTAVTNSTGSAGSIAGIGSDLVAANNLTLEASSLPPGQFAYFVNGPSPGFVAGPGGSQGNLCLLGGLGRHRLQVGTADAAGVYSIQVDLTSFPRPTGFVAVQPGETWHFSCWYRDQNPTPTSNFTDGLTITFQ